MTRRERLMRTLRGEPVDRPPFNFYEIHGQEDRSPENPYNIYSDPSWHPLLDLARDRTDRIIMHGAGMRRSPLPWDAATRREVVEQDGSRFTTYRLQIGSRELVRRVRQDRDVNTIWTLEHPLRSVEDVELWLSLPPPEPEGEPVLEGLLQAEKELGDTGIVLLDTADPLCMAAEMFEMSDYTVLAMTEPVLFRRILDRFAILLHHQTEAFARAAPGRHWRIFGPEFATPPYLPPHLFREYVVDYVRPMVESIHRYGGFARIHCHGRIREVLDDIVATGCMGIDPIEPPPQGNVSLAYVRERYGRQLVLFGNLEASDIENLTPEQFERKVWTALEEGTQGEGRGFLLQPSACPYGRKLSEKTLTNYHVFVDTVDRWAGKG